MQRSLTPALTALSLTVAVALVPACGSAADVDAAAAHGASSDGALDAAAILAFVNSAAATEQALDVNVGLDARAARAIAGHVWGADGAFGTADDDHCETLAELDAIAYVGDAALRALEAYVAALAPSPGPGGGVTGEPVDIEGVTFTAEEAASALVHCNDRSEAQLDDDVGLDARAAHAIVVGRPHTGLDSIAGAAYVGATALEKIRAYAALHPVAVGPAPGPGTSAPRILSVSAAVHTDLDPEWDETLDGVLTVWATERATRCDLAIYTTTGALLETQANIGTSGERFDAGWAEPNTTYPNVAVVLTCRDQNGATVTASARTDDVGAPAPGAIPCDATGGTFDGVAFTRDQECAAATFMNRARWSQMGLLSDAARRIAYDGNPSGNLGQRVSSWTNVAAFAALPGVGNTAVQSLKVASAQWVDDGAGRFDTVALTWQNRAALGAAQAPISLDRVFVSRKTVDASSAMPRACVEVRDFEGAPNYIEACLFYINADSAPGCSGWRINDCLDAAVGDHAKIRGRVRVANGRTSITMHTDGPMEARATID